ncbi:hypothetical protein [Streptomyces sp. NPDC046712]|uniref:hypothetical protein n=1 Tax=Streptomyces sp. NPDC046712 TaxID=3154802 RepID=UPI0033D5DC37
MNNTLKRTLAAATVTVVAALGMAGTAHADSGDIHGVGDLVDVGDVISLQDVLNDLGLLSTEREVDGVATTAGTAKAATATTGAKGGALGPVGSLLGLGS